MCGIVGNIGSSSHDIQKMNLSQVHRGPDSDGFYFDHQNHVLMAMRRLAIIDIAGGEQPMISQDGRYCLVYNGEIFNSPDLKLDLEQKGEIFESDHSDTEVLFKLLIREGKQALLKLNGMFGFAFYDKVEQRVLLGRDRFGIKPLYYFPNKNGLSFASELKSLKSLPHFDDSVSHSALFHYMSLQYVVGEQSIYSRVKRLEPGHCLEYKIKDRKYEISRWSETVAKPDLYITDSDWPELIREKLEEAVLRWSLSDVPLAISLSGGLDSSAIAGICAKNNIDIQAFSLGFTGENEADWNELPLARQVAEKWNLSYNETILAPEELINQLPKMVSSLDEPYGGGLPSWFIYSVMEGKTKVAHTGTGGDEMFGNYGKWTGLEGGRFNFGYYKNLNRIDRKRFKEKFFERYYYFNDTQKRSLFIGSLKKTEDTAELLFNRFISSEAVNCRDAIALSDSRTQLCDEFLLMTDRFSMAHSIEARTPFLDNEFVDLVMTIPANIRTNPKDLKGLLRRAVSPYLPTELLTAPKKGFVIPLGQWMRNNLRDLVETLLGKEYLKNQGLIRPEFYDDFVTPHLGGQADHTNKLWTLLMFQMWYQQHKKL